MDKPERCIDPVVKFCQECKYGYCIYPEWVETAEDMKFCSFESGCCFGLEDTIPTAEELEEFKKEMENIYGNR